MGVHILPSQSFQAVSNSGELLGDVFSIVTETCSTTGLCVVTWHQVLKVLPGAGSAMLGQAEVSFLKDMGGELILPLRLKSHPEHTLTIVVFDSTSRYGVDNYPFLPSPVSPLSLKPMPIPLRDVPSGTRTDQAALKQDASKHSGSTKPSNRKMRQYDNSRTSDGSRSTSKCDPSPVKLDLLELLISLPPESQAVMNAYIQQYCFYIQSIKAGCMIRAFRCTRELEKLLEQLSPEKYKNKPLRDQLNHMRRRLEEIQKPFVEAHEEAHAKLAVIQDRIQSVFQEATSNSAHRSPRLFVVLPVTGCFSDPHSKRFRVFFLCGCETYTRAATPGSKVVHLLHLSTVEGYDLKDHAVFFDKFGSLVLGMMLLLKHGYSNSQVAVPPCKNNRLFKGCKAMQGCPLLVTQCAEALVDETIEFIQAQTSSDAQGEADWDQVLPYLHIYDKDGDVGNLAQSRISESFPDWNCVDHISRSIADPNIQDVLEANGGFLDKEQGAIQITLSSRSTAKSFYKSMIKECGFWKWDVTLDWDATREDLQLFASCISNVAVVHLTIHGQRLQGRTSGAAEQSIRFRPLVEIMSSGRVQYMCLEGFDNFFSCVGGEVHRSLLPSLLELSIDTELSCMDTTEKNGLVTIFESCPRLEELLLSCKTIEPVFQYFAGICTHLPRLKLLDLVSRGLRLRIHCADRAIIRVTAEVTSIVEISPEDRGFLHDGHLSGLLWREPPSDFALSPDLRTILHGNSGLMQVEISVPARQICAVVNEFHIFRQLLSRRENPSTKSKQDFSMLGRLILFTHGLGNTGGEQSITTGNSGARDDKDVGVAMIVEYQNFTTKPTITIDLEMSPSASAVNMEATLDLCKQYGSSLRSLITNAHFNDDLAVHIDEVVYKDGYSSLRTLVLNPTGLSFCKVDDIERVLSYVPHLEDFLLQLEQLEDFEQQEKAVRLLENHGPRLTGLWLSGRQASTWLRSSGSRDEKLAHSGLMTPQTLTNLKSLSIVCNESQHIYLKNVEWIASMVTAPTPLTEIRLEGIVIHLTDWELIFKATCFSSLVELSVKASNVSRDVLLSLVRCIPSTRSGVPLRTLNLASTPVARREDAGKWDPVVSGYLAGLKKRAPYTKVYM